MLRRILDSPWTYFLLAGLLLVVAVLSQFELRPRGHPPGSLEDLGALSERDDVNVVFAVIDTLRADRLGIYGYERDTSPWLDELARGGIRFARTESQSTWTKTSMASIWTATYPERNGVLRWGQALPIEARMPAEILAEAGFRTGGVFRNGWVAPNFGFAQGFDLYVKPMQGVAFRPPGALQQRVPVHQKLMGSDEDVTRTGLEFLHTYRDQRFFLYLHYMDVHQYAWGGDAELFGSRYSDAYDNAVRWTDRNIGAVVTVLDELAILDRTLIVIASDHGEEFLEHGGEGHAKTLYRETTEVPLILALPFRLEPGIVVEELVQNVDIWPTVMDLLGLPVPEGVDGRSLLPAIRAAAAGTGTDGKGRPAFSHLDRSWAREKEEPKPVVSVRDRNYRLIVNRPGEQDSVVELFDHSTDPGEQRSLAERRPEVQSRLEALVADYLDQPAALWGEPIEVEIDELERGQLQALGYIGR